MKSFNWIYVWYLHKRTITSLGFKYCIIDLLYLILDSIALVLSTLIAKWLIRHFQVNFFSVWLPKHLYLYRNTFENWCKPHIYIFSDSLYSDFFNSIKWPLERVVWWVKASHSNRKDSVKPNKAIGQALEPSFITRLPVTFKLKLELNTQWLTLGRWGCILDNCPKLTLGQPGSK